MASITVRVEGLKELEESLEQFSRATGKNILARALRKAAEPVRQAAKQKVHKDTGALAESIQTVVRKNMRNKGLVYATTGPEMRGGSYRQLKTPVPYSSKGVRAGKMRTYQIGSHPGVYGMFEEFGTIDTPAHPFMRPAWEEQKGAALDVLKTEIKTKIDKAAARAARKAARIAAKG